MTIDYNKCSDEEFDDILADLCQEHGTGWMLGIGDVNAIVREELNAESETPK